MREDGGAVIVHVHTRDVYKRIPNHYADVICDRYHRETALRAESWSAIL